MNDVSDEVTRKSGTECCVTQYTVAKMRKKINHFVEYDHNECRCDTDTGMLRDYFPCVRPSCMVL